MSPETPWDHPGPRTSTLDSRRISSRHKSSLLSSRTPISTLTTSSSFTTLNRHASPALLSHWETWTKSFRANSTLLPHSSWKPSMPPSSYRRRTIATLHQYWGKYHRRRRHNISWVLTYFFIFATGKRLDAFRAQRDQNSPPASAAS